MSFHFLPWTQWDNKDLVEQLKIQITKELNSGPPNPLLKSPLRVTELSFGSSEPNVRLENIMECSLDRVELIFAFGYKGDGYLKIETTAQINKLAPIKPSYASYSNLTGNSILSMKPSIMPLELTICDLIIDGSIRIRMDRVQKHSIHQWVLSVQLLSDPLKQLIVNNNFQDTFPATKEFFTNIILTEAQKAINDLMDHPKLIDINLDKDKTKEEKNTEGSVTVTTTDLNPTDNHGQKEYVL